MFHLWASDHISPMLLTDGHSWRTKQANKNRPIKMADYIKNNQSEFHSSFSFFPSHSCKENG
jgi:hypothetical protein